MACREAHTKSRGKGGRHSNPPASCPSPSVVAETVKPSIAEVKPVKVEKKAKAVQPTLTRPRKKRRRRKKSAKLTKVDETTTKEFWPTPVDFVTPNALPFNKDDVARRMDIFDCTYVVIDKREGRCCDDTATWRAIMSHATKKFSANAFKLRGGSTEYHAENAKNPFRDGRTDAAWKPIDEKLTPSTKLELPTGVFETTYMGRILVLTVDHKEGQMVLLTQGKGKSSFLQQFIEMLLRINTYPLETPPPRTTFKMYRWNVQYLEWYHVTTEKARKMDSVILPQGFKDMVIKDMERFLSPDGKAWYEKYSIPYKRSYMFYGLPGTGKTSMIKALAGHFERRVCFMAAHHPTFTDEVFNKAVRSLPSRAIAVLEDIDSLFDKNRKTMNQKSPLTFTGLLNGLDGIGEPSGTIFIMTTNFIDRLDPALVRAGRVDMKIKFEAATDEQLHGCFMWFYEHDPDAAKYAPLFVKSIRETHPDREVTMAELQGHFIAHYDKDAKTCMEGVKDYHLDDGHAKLAREKVGFKGEGEKKNSPKKTKSKKASNSRRRNKKGNREQVEVDQ